MSSKKPLGAFFLACAAAISFWAGWYLQIVSHSTIMSVIGAAAIAAPILLLIGRGQPAFASAAGFLLAVFPAAGLIIHLVEQGYDIDAVINWQLWPLIIGALAAALALSLLPDAEVKTYAATGIFVFATSCSIAAMLGYAGLLERWVLATPIHCMIAIVTAVVLSAQLLALTTIGYTRGASRFTSGLIQLLPLLGFAGTIIGIMTALDSLPQLFSVSGDQDALDGLLFGLSGAFETTLLGIFASIGTSFIQNLVPESAA